MTTSRSCSTGAGKRKESRLSHARSPTCRTTLGLRVKANRCTKAAKKTILMFCMPALGSTVVGKSLRGNLSPTVPREETGSHIKKPRARALLISPFTITTRGTRATLFRLSPDKSSSCRNKAFLPGKSKTRKSCFYSRNSGRPS